uniref:Uncharacterized protein n=1 Tax=Chionoecetes opilio bacilliform virus TaxID=1825681 RepID=A0A1Q3DLG4_9VIRU|nr:hypothetical protein [Chionoecetes opilio bacilliform virus]GAV93219.1 hypothetical protein SCV_099 [Chionoecetes opilio bacilliform virus]
MTLSEKSSGMTFVKNILAIVLLACVVIISALLGRRSKKVPVLHPEDDGLPTNNVMDGWPSPGIDDGLLDPDIHTIALHLEKDYYVPDK